MINSSEARTDKLSLQTVIDGKRDIAAIIPKDINKNEKLVYDKLIKHNLLYLKTSNPYGLIIIYRKSKESNAKKLQKIIQKNGGFLAKDHKIIGKLLEYKDIRKNPKDEELLKQIKIKSKPLLNGNIAYGIYFYDLDEWVCIGGAEYNPKIESVEDVDIDKYFRKQGLGTHLYNYIEADQNIKLKPYKTQSPQGKKFWKKRLSK